MAKTDAVRLQHLIEAAQKATAFVQGREETGRIFLGGQYC